MPDLFMDPRLTDNYSEHDWRAVQADDAARDAVIEAFLSEKLCTVHGYRVADIDWDFLATVSLPQTWAMKKFRFQALLDEAERPSAQQPLTTLLHTTVFRGDRDRTNRFIGQLRVMKRIADDMTKRLLGDLHLEITTYVCRFSETRMENLHYDMDDQSDDHEAFRLYLNLDNAPRIWATSYSLTELIERGGARLVGDLDDNLPSETLLKRVTTRAYGGWNQRATERMSPRHLVFFDPGDIWLVDGRSVSHQVLSGHRVLTIYAKLPHATNPKLKSTFGNKIRGAIGRGKHVPVGSETAIVNYYTPDQVSVGGPVDIKGDWERVFGDTGTGRIRRFNDAGMSPQGN